MADITDPEDLSANIDQVNSCIRDHAKKTGRKADQIELIVVTKQKPPLVVKQLAEIGQLKIGESYLDEAEFKMKLLRDYPIEWHMIGNIQSGKERKIVRNFDVIHSVDQLKTAGRINRAAGELNKRMPVFLEINISGEETKAGWKAIEENQWIDFADDYQLIAEMENLALQGLMTMAPYDEEPENARPYFRKLNELLFWINERFPEDTIHNLSMGMSGDYSVAVEEGATHLRLGSAVVGSR